MLFGLLAVILFQSVLLAYFMYERGVTEQRGVDERADLLQRIQAPDTAVYSHAVAELPPDPPALPYDDDEAFHASRDELVTYLAQIENSQT